MNFLSTMDGNTDNTYQLRHKGVWVSFTINVIHDASDNVLEYLFVGNDITASQES